MVKKFRPKRKVDREAEGDVSIDLLCTFLCAVEMQIDLLIPVIYVPLWRAAAQAVVPE